MVGTKVAKVDGKRPADPSIGVGSVGRFVAMLGVAFAYLLVLTTVFGIASKPWVSGSHADGASVLHGSSDGVLANPANVVTLLLPLIAITPLLLLLASTVPLTRRRLLGWALVSGSVATVVSATLNLVGFTVAGFGNRMDVILPSAIMVALFGFYYLFTTVAVLLADLTIRVTVPAENARRSSAEGP